MHTRGCNQILHFVQDDTTKLMQLIFYLLLKQLLVNPFSDLHTIAFRFR